MQQRFPTHSETVTKRSDHFHKVRIVTVSRDSALNQRCWIYLPMIHSLSMFAPLFVHWWSEWDVLLTILNTRARIKKTELLNYSHLTLQHIKKLCASTMEHGTVQKIFCEFAQGFPRYQCLRDSIKRLRYVIRISWGNLSTAGAPAEKYWSSWFCCSFWALQHSTSWFLSSGVHYAQSIWHKIYVHCS